MSLACLALRLITRRALEGRTLAGARVRDSELAPLSAIIEGQGQPITGPVISLYIDQTTGACEGRELNGVDSDVHLLIEIAADASVSQEGIEIPATSAGLETTLDVIAYQVKLALLDVASPWSALWNRLVSTVRRVETLRGADFLKTGNRFAARQIDMTVQLLLDPIPGAPVDFAWSDIVAALAADPEFDDVATMLDTVIAGRPLPEWRRSQFALGDTVEDAEVTGYAPLGGGPTDAIVPMVEATLRDTAPGAPDPSYTIEDATPASFEP